MRELELAGSDNGRWWPAHRRRQDRSVGKIRCGADRVPDFGNLAGRANDCPDPSIFWIGPHALRIKLGAKLDFGAEVARQVLANPRMVLPGDRADIDADG